MRSLLLGRLHHLTSFALLLSLWLTGAPSAAADSSAQKRVIRQHVSLVDGNERTIYVLTRINEFDDSKRVTVLLVDDLLYGKRWLFRSVDEVSKTTVTSEVSDPRRKVYVRRSFDRPVTARTFAELRAKMDADPEIFAIADMLVKLEAPAFTHVLRESEFTKREVPRQWVSDLRRTLDPDLLDAIERMRATGLFTAQQGAGLFFDGFLEYLFHSECAPSLQLTTHEMQADCDFDKGFGFPCSERQLERVTKARREQRVLKFY